MTKVFYSLCGEGLGHATRTDAILSKLDDNFEIHLFTWGEAYQYFLNKKYPRLHRIAEMPFGRNRVGQISLWKTARNFIRFLKNKPASDAYIKEQVANENPDFFICDYESLLPRIAKQKQIPYISIDNQHRFSRSDLSTLPWQYQFHGKLIGYFTEFFIPRPDLAIISSFCHFPINRPKTIHVGTVLRPVVEMQNPQNNDFVLLYYKASCGDLLLRFLRETKQRVVVYGCPKEKEIVGNIEYKELNAEAFAKDLSLCRCIFSAAGNQLLGEAIYFGKPLFMVPEQGQYEQIINAYYVQNLGRGCYYFPNNITYNDIVNFLNTYTPIDVDKHVNGADEAAKIISQFKGTREK